MTAGDSITLPGTPATATSAEQVFTTTDHKVVGRLFIATSLVLAVVAAVARALAGVDAAGTTLLGSTAGSVGLSATFALVFCGLVPLALGLGVYLVPLQVGARALAFPRAAAAAFWSWLVCSVLFIVSTVADGGIGGGDDQMARLGMWSLVAIMVALSLAAVCVVTTCLTQRALGMTVRRMPMLSFSLMVHGVLLVALTAVALSAVITAKVAGMGATELADPSTGIVAHLGFLIQTPTIWLVALPVLGILGDVVPTLAGRRLIGRSIFQGLIGALGLVSFGAWTAAGDPVDSPLYLLVSGVAVLAVLGTLGGAGALLRSGKVTMTGGLLLVLVSGIPLLVGAGLAFIGALNRAGSGEVLDFAAGHPVAGSAEFVMGGALAGLLGALFHWGPKLYGAGPGDKNGRLLAALVLPAATLGGLGAVLAIIGELADSDLSRASAWLMVIGSALVGAAALVAWVATLGASAEDGPADPWNGPSLEWSTPSPPPVDNFDAEPGPVASAAPLYDARSADEAGEEA